MKYFNYLAATPTAANLVSEDIMVPQFKLVSAKNGFHDFDVINAGSIKRVTVSNSIERGGQFNIYYGESSKESGTWVGTTGIEGYLTGDLERSVIASQVYQSEHIDSEAFANTMADQHCKCGCVDPSYRNDGPFQVIGVDLKAPDYQRQQSRYISFAVQCVKCKLSTVLSEGFASISIVGLDELKRHAEVKALAKGINSIDWSNVTTEF
ncbi:hypothetical protein OCF84_21515 (plasmid) [Shewanella xiamenensis]|uniref:Uncharacterized protein n=1 Tax=Shewanella xiamenensis TaxID=332186 RepID=A0ABT6UH06_9GAMM|nr:hypothetical protein [Shewanella xiamenensis]MDI5832544.1 hypothetical protein [Shewanella xiamenensis]WHF57838.1 hypothetical protein OCF84_21515 [Shewanella xiamenensis]